MENKVDTIQFTQLGFEYEIGEPEVTEPTKRRTRRSSSGDISLSSIKTIKSKQGTIKLASVTTCKVVEDSKKSSVVAIQIYQPKTSRNSLIGAVARKGYEDQQVKTSDYAYTKKDRLLTKTEKSMYDLLVTQFGNSVTVLVKVRLADIVNVNNTTTRDTKYFKQVENEAIDFLICDKQNLSLICVIELDDDTNETQSAEIRAERKQLIKNLLQECNIEILRTNFKLMRLEENHLRKIERLILEHQTPQCPTCKGKMSINVSKRQKNYGHRFYGCINYPNCRETIDID